MNKAVIEEVRPNRVTMADDAMPLMAIKFRMGESKDPETPNSWHSLTMDADGSDSSQLLVTLKVGKANAAGDDLDDATATTYKWSGDGAGADETAAANLGALIAALSAIDGIEVYRLNAPADLSLATDDFIDLAETEIPTHFINVLYQDVSEIHAVSMRIGIPEVRDSGRMKLLGVAGTCTGNTNGTVKISRDPNDESADDEEELRQFTLQTAQTAYINDDMNDAAVYRGPILVEVASDDLSALDMVVRTVLADY